MSFIITVYTNEGIIMASDSRTTYTTTNTLPNGVIEKRFGIQTTDTTYKTFLCNSRVGISTCGDASINGKPIAGYIEEFISKNDANDITVEEIAQRLLDYFSGFNPRPAVAFLVAGYDPNNQQRVYKVSTFSNTVNSIDTSVSGAVWDGELEVFQKVVLPVALKNEDGSYIDFQIRSIGFNFFTLQDAIDFAEYAVDITIKTMYFQDYVNTVGGPIDILAIKPSGSSWVQRKELHA